MDDRDHFQRHPDTDGLLAQIEAAFPELEVRVDVTVDAADDWTDVFVHRGGRAFLTITLITGWWYSAAIPCWPATISGSNVNDIVPYALPYLAHFLEGRETPRIPSDEPYDEDIFEAS